MPAKLAYEEIKPPMQLAAAGCFDIFDPARTRPRRKRRHQSNGPKPFTDTNGVSLPPTALQLVKLVLLLNLSSATCVKAHGHSRSIFR
jgi:hypothetical protein